MDLLTLDTNVVLDYSRDDPTWRADVERLVELAAAGDVDLVVTRYVHDDVSGAWVSRLRLLPTTETAGVFQLDVSRLDGGDGLGDQRIVDLEHELWAVASVKGAKFPGPTDWLHLHAHRIQERDVFLTRDKAILLIADELAGVGIVVMTPEAYLTLRSGLDGGVSGPGADE